MSIKSVNIKLVVVLSSFFILISSFMAGRVLAADAIPDGGRVDCSKMSDPEYASDRPYQASICGDRPITYWCGNDVVVNLGTVKVPYCDRNGGQETECPCKNNCVRDQKIDVDLTDVELPILGNTELTKNSESATDQIDDGTKVSNYVAWYLGGTNGRAEYGFSDPSTAEGVSKIVDTSGPLKKLLPSIIQDAVRWETIKTASTKTSYSTDTEGELNITSQPVSENENHNQIVVCANKDGAGIFTGLLDLLSLGKYTPTECYSGGGAQATGDKVLRLLNWEDDKLAFNIVSNSIVSTGIAALKLLYPFVPAGAIETSIGDHWELARPPLPWSDKSGKAFATDAEYQKAYYEWKGNACAIIPIINKVVCIRNVFVPSLYADLYQYVPLANTVDKKGSHMVTNTHITAPRATLEDVSYQIIHSPQLYLAHSLENTQLSDALKTTYKPKVTAAAEGGAAEIPKDVENNSQCRIIPSRTNPGDDATFTNPQSHIEVDVQYTITMIQCTNIHWVDDCSDYTGKCNGNGHYDADCSSDIYATVNSVGKFAYSDEIWNNTVAGSDSIFRRIYPKTGAGSPVTCIADTPAASNATYTLNDNSSPGLELLRVQEPDKTSVKSEDGKVINAQLYYPHYGGVLDYFLNGIQQALRPKGFGPGQPTDGQYCSNVSCGELPDGLTKAHESCTLGSNSGLNVPSSLKAILEAAGETYKVPPSLILGVMYGEGAFNPGRYSWTETNVKNWATCMPLPNCSPGGDTINSVVPFIGTYWNNLAQAILPDLQKIDPTKTQANPCNLLDATFALAKDLHDNAGGSSSLTGKSCFGVAMSSTNPTSCNWNDSQLETAIRVWEFGTTYDSTYQCATKENSCATGGGAAANCPTGGDTCETVSNRYPNPSHNACVWDIAKSVPTSGR